MADESPARPRVLWQKRDPLGRWLVRLSDYKAMRTALQAEIAALLAERDDLLAREARGYRNRRAGKVRYHG